MSMSMRESLDRQKKKGLIDFMSMTPDITGKHKQFIVKDLSVKNYGKFSFVFFDNKYRQDNISRETFLVQVESDLKAARAGINDVGVYNTQATYDYYLRLAAFLL